MQNVPVRRGYAQFLAMALGALPPQFMDAMRHIRAERRWQPNGPQRRIRISARLGQATKRKARNRRRNKIARVSRRANRH